MVSILFKSGVQLNLDIHITKIDSQSQPGKVIIKWVNGSDKIIYLDSDEVVAVVSHDQKPKIPFNNPRFNEN